MATNDQGNKQSDKSGGKKETSKRGFASMDPEQQREIAAEGGRAAHQKGTAHEFTSEEARRAGSMSHKNDARNSQSAAGGNKGSGGEEKEQGASGGRGAGKSGGSGSKS